MNINVFVEAKEMKPEAWAFSRIGIVIGIFLLLVLIDSCFGQTTLTLNVLSNTQEHSEWCWAASSKAVLDYYSHPQSQCSIANWAWNRSDCCGNEEFVWDHPCNKPIYTFGTPSVQAILSNWGVNSSASSSALSPDASVAEINAGRPFVIRWALKSCNLDCGHFVVGMGCDLDLSKALWISYQDPAPGIGYQKHLYSAVVDDVQHTWTHSLQITVPAGVLGDTYENPYIIPAGPFPVVMGGTTAGFNNDLAKAPSCLSGIDTCGPDVFFSFTAPASGDYIVWIQGNDWSWPAHTWVSAALGACGCASPQSSAQGPGVNYYPISAIAGTNYRIVLGGQGVQETGHCSAGTYTLEVGPCSDLHTPGGLAASAISSTSAKMNWDVARQPPGTNTALKRYLPGDTEGAIVFSGPDGGDFLDTGLTPGTTYSYRVAAAHSYCVPFPPLSNPVYVTLPSSYILTVAKAGTGTGAVTSNPHGIDCGAGCSSEFGSGTQVILSAQPVAGSNFVGWSGEGCSGTESCVVTMSQARTVTATFDLVQPNPTLTVTKSGLGIGTVTSNPSGVSCGSTCSASFPNGTQVRLTPTPQFGSTFGGWSGGGCSGTGQCVVGMSTDQSVQVIFNLIPQPQTGKIVYIKGGNVWIMNTDGTSQTQLTSGGGATIPRLANGVVVFQEGGQLRKTDAAGTSPSPILNTVGVLEYDLDPAGQRIVMTYNGMAGSNYRNFILYTMNLDGSGKVAINTTSNMHQFCLYWGRDGYIYLDQTIVGDPYKQKVFRIPEGGVDNPTLLVNYFSQYAAEGGLSGKVAFLYNQPAPKLGMINSDGSGQIDVANSPAGILGRIAYDYDQETIYFRYNNQIWRINPDGTGLRMLVSSLAGTDYDLDYGTVAKSSGIAAMTIPPPGSTLTSSTVTFAWSAGSGVSEYYLQVGTTPGGQERYSVSEGLNLSATVMGLPTDGSTVYVRLWSKIGGLWSYNDYTYVSCTGCTTTKAEMTTPTPEATLSSSMTTFWWNASLGSECYLQVGTTMGGQEIYSAGQGTNLSVQVPALPTDGSLVYARLWTNIGGVWLYNDYTYTACSGCTATKAVMTSPATGSTLNSSSVTFTWSNSLASQYYLQVGTVPGGQQIYSAGQGTNLSTQVTGLPIGGDNVYVRLWSELGGMWWYSDYSYLACSGCTPTQAAMTTPAPGSTLSSTMVTFKWGTSLASECYLQVGTTAGGQEIYSAGEGTNLSSQVMDLPNNGGAVYVRLWSKIGGAWLFNDYTYTACTGCTATKAAMVTPASGSTLSSRAVTFTWSAGLSVEYYLFVGTSAGGQEIYSAGQGTNLSVELSGIPNNGSTVRVRLWSRIGGAWLFNDYTYTACTGCQ